MTPAEIKSKLTGIDNFLKDIAGRVSNLLNNILVSHIPGVSDILNWLHDRVADISHTIESIVGSIVGAVGTAIGAVLPTAVDFLLGTANGIFDDVHSILGNLATAEEFVAGAIGEIGKHAGGIAATLIGAIGGGISGGLIDVLKFLEGQDAATIDHFLDQILAAKSLPGWMHSMVSGLRGRGAEWQALAMPLLVGVLLQPIGEAMVNPLLVELKQESNMIFKTEALTVPDAIRAYMRGQIQSARFYAEMSYNNLNPERSDRIFESQFVPMEIADAIRLHLRGELSKEDLNQVLIKRGFDFTQSDPMTSAARPLLSEDEIRQTFLRGIIDRPKHDSLMAQHGYTQERINQKVNLYYLIPGPADLIHMGIRNVFDETIVKRFELAQDAPQAFFHAAAQQGISQDWALKFWEAHWIVPGTDEAFRMYQRTVARSEDPEADTITLLDGSKVQNIIGKNTLNLFLKDKDTPPYYRNKLTEIAYHPLNRIDVRRMFGAGSLNKVGVQRAYLDLGYSLHNATLLADFVERYYAQAKKDKAQPFIDGLRRKILDLYIADKLELSDASFAITDLNFTKEEADYYLAEAKLVQQAADAEQVEAGIGRLYTKLYITKEDASKRLADAKVPALAIARLIRKWDLQIELNQDTEHFHKARDLTKSELLEAYKDKLVDRATTEGFLEMLGYPKVEAEMLLGLADYRAERETRVATMDAVKQLYVNGIRDIQTTRNSLDSLHLPVAQRDSLLIQWQLLRETRTEKLPIATLRDMVKANILSSTQVFDHLKRHRFTDDDANLLLELWTQTKPKGGGLIGAITGG